MSRIREIARIAVETMEPNDDHYPLEIAQHRLAVAVQTFAWDPILGAWRALTSGGAVAETPSLDDDEWTRRSAALERRLQAAFPDAPAHEILLLREVEEAESDA